MSNFFSIMETVREEILEGFVLPLGITYWKFLIYMAFAAIVIVALVNKLPISLADRSIAEEAARNRRDRYRSNRHKKEGD